MLYPMKYKTNMANGLSFVVFALTGKVRALFLFVRLFICLFVVLFRDFVCKSTIYIEMMINTLIGICFTNARG